MTRSRRLRLVMLCSLGALITEFVDDLHRYWLTEKWGSAPIADVVVWTMINVIWMFPLLHPQVRRDVRFRPTRMTWTVLLLLPYPLVNVAIGKSLPVLQQFTETGLLALIASQVQVSLHVFWEEVLFRGYVLYRSDLNPRFAIVVSAIFFVFLHFLGNCPPFNLFFVFFLGLATGVVRIVSGGLAWPIVFHATTNLLCTVLAPHSELAWAVICLATSAISTVIVLWRHPMFKREDAVLQCGSDQRQTLSACS